MNALILGGNGYVGSKVTRKLVSLGYKVVCTRRNSSNLSRLEDLSNQLIWIPASADAVETAALYTHFDFIINMACSYERSNALSYTDVIESNINFPLKVLDIAVKYGTKTCLTIGTGLPDDINMYSFSKKKLSEFGKFYVIKHGINFNNLKLQMLYGADEPQNRFLPSVIHKMVRGEIVETTIGTQRRDIISAEDIVDAIILVLKAKLQGFNEIPVGTGVAPTISEIIDFIWEKTGKKSVVNKGVVSMRNNEPDCVADTTILQSLGIWKPKFWQDGLIEMIDAIRSKNLPPPPENSSDLSKLLKPKCHVIVTLNSPENSFGGHSRLQIKNRNIIHHVMLHIERRYAA